MKKTLVIVALLLVSLVGGGSVWFVRHKRAEEKREAIYRAALTDFERGLHLGMPRAEVEKFLVSRNLSYSRPSGAIWVKIGTDPNFYFICDAGVYVDLEFSYLKGRVEPTSLDNLKSIALRRFGEDCL
jgi:hypothetical protein